MRELNKSEISMFFSDDSFEDYDCVAIESTIKKLSDLKAGTACGIIGNQCFKSLVQKFGERKCRGWYNKDENSFWGMFHIEVKNQTEADEIEELTEEGRGSLRENVRLNDGFWEFEIE
ncbi:MAG: hypothetical protein ACFFG0_01680 [Candidatus Thorarchaeota archaeon]